jgi:large subunit ribosomal protein L4
VQLPVKNVEGKTVKKLKVDDLVFGLKPHRAVVHQTLLAQLANRRAGAASTKTRSEVRGSGTKLQRQKGTGRARRGSMSSPTLRGGAVAFGPKPRSFAQGLPKRMRRLALRSVLSAKAADGSISVLDRLSVDTPRTKEMARVLQNLGLERSTLIVTAEPDRSVFVSSRNLPAAKVVPAACLSVVDLLSCRNLLMTVDAVRKVEELWGGDRARSVARGRQATAAPSEPAVAEAAAPQVEEPAAEAEEPTVEAEEPAPVAVEAVKEPVAAEPASKPKRRTRTVRKPVPATAEEEAPTKPRRRRAPATKSARSARPKAEEATKAEESAPNKETGEE